MTKTERGLENPIPHRNLPYKSALWRPRVQAPTPISGPKYEFTKYFASYKNPLISALRYIRNTNRLMLMKLLHSSKRCTSLRNPLISAPNDHGHKHLINISCFHSIYFSIWFQHQNSIGAGAYIRSNFPISKSSNFKDFGYRRRHHKAALYGIIII